MADDKYSKVRVKLISSMFVRRTEYDKSGQSELDEKTRGAPLDEQT